MKKLFIVAGLLFLFGSLSMAQDLISVADLAKELKNPDYIVVSAEIPTEYAKVHITGSVNISYKDFFKPGSIEGLMIADADIAKVFAEDGVSETKKIVVYDEGSMKYASRVYWILKYMGAPNVMVLNGGLEAWKAGRKPVTKNPSTVEKASFNGKANPGMIASADDVKAAAGKSAVVVVDVREANEYKGLDGKSKGHIPGSINIEHLALLDAKGLMKSKDELEKIFAASGVTKDKTIYLYCATGVRTGKAYIALTKILAYPNVKVYDGGLNEWIALGNKVDK
ncbi:MAG: sulfurtransferase [Bacteroidetes bacterium]|nr:sulfurtransferase [Bacteroidota bacterium]